VNPGHFSGVPAVNLGEVVARYNIFGGPSHIALRPDGLAMEFPVLLPEDSGLVQRIIEHVFVAFQQTLPDHQYYDGSGQSLASCGNYGWKCQ